MKSFGRSWGDTPPVEPTRDRGASGLRRVAAVIGLAGVLGVAGLAGAAGASAATYNGGDDSTPPTHAPMGRTWA